MDPISLSEGQNGPLGEGRFGVTGGHRIDEISLPSIPAQYPRAKGREFL